MNIWLIGMMGSGKTTVGRLLAHKRMMDFHDVDAIITTRAAGSVSELWRRSGEDGFRAIEATVVEELAAGDGAVIASGGGAVMQDGNRQAMRRSGLVIWLQASPDILAARLVDADDRPLLADGSSGRITELLEKRLGAYQEAAHHAVDTSHLTPGEVVDKVDELL